jgi:hypothetical protein
VGCRFESGSGYVIETLKQNTINHIGLVIDGSSSMAHLSKEVIKVADAQIAYLAKRSQELKQETRVSVYIFNHTVRCVIFDMDVLRLPSIAQLYGTSGRTALIDAALKSQQDLETTSTIYGDHSFLTFILTDGEENESKYPAGMLTKYLQAQGDNWTVAVLVPNATGKFEAKRFGFPADNVAIWDATTVAGVTEVGETIRRATDNYMMARSTGTFRGTRSLFSMSNATLNSTAVLKADLKPLRPGQFVLFDVDQPWAIREWVESRGLPYNMGSAFYQLTKSELIQARKDILVRNKKTGLVYSGANARAMVGLPDDEIRVRPEHNPDFDVFVQSTSVNRKLVPGTKLLVLR